MPRYALQWRHDEGLCSYRQIKAQNALYSGVRGHGYGCGVSVPVWGVGRLCVAVREVVLSGCMRGGSYGVFMGGVLGVFIGCLKGVWIRGKRECKKGCGLGVKEGVKRGGKNGWKEG